MPVKNPQDRTTLALSPVTRQMLDDHAPVGHDGRVPSPSLAADVAVQSYYAWIDVAWREVEGRFSDTDLFLVMAALSTTYIEPSIIPCLADEMREFYVDGPDNDPEVEPWPTAAQTSLIERASALPEIHLHALVCAARRQYAVRRAAIAEAERAAKK